MPFKSYIEKSYLVAFEVPKNLKYTYITMENPSISTRFYEDRGHVYQIYLGKSHMTGLKQDDVANFEQVKMMHSPVSEKSISWSNVDVFSFDHLPFVGRIRKNMYIATGFLGWGMAQSVLSAHMLQSFVTDENPAYTSFFLIALTAPFLSPYFLFYTNHFV